MKLTEKDVVLFLGDSITDGGHGRSMDLNHIFGHGFAEMICSRLGADSLPAMPKFINKGISGNNTSQILARLDTDVIPYKPTIINLLCGVNDVCYSGEGDTHETAIRNTEEIIKKLQSSLPGVKIILCEPFYMDVRNQDAPYENIPHVECEEKFFFGNYPYSPEKVEKFSGRMAKLQNALPSIAEKYGLIFVPFQKMFGEASEHTPASYFIWDNVHPTMIGHRLMADKWFEVVEKAL